MTRAGRVRFLSLVLVLETTVAVTLVSANIRERTASGPFVADGPVRREIAGFPTLRPLPPPDPYETIFSYPVDTEARLGFWQEKVFRGKSEYHLAGDPDKMYVEGSSRDASSSLFVKTDFRASPDVVLDWTWRANVFPAKRGSKRLADQSQDDFAARIYVIFAGTNFFNTRVVEYIWDEWLPVGTAASSPFSGNVKLFVIASGREPGDGWRREVRNIRKDYKTLFGDEPERPVAALAFMTDSDNTGTRTAADFGNFTVKKKKSGGPAASGVTETGP